MSVSFFSSDVSPIAVVGLVSKCMGLAVTAPEVNYVANTIFEAFIMTDQSAAQFLKLAEKYLCVDATTPGFCYLLFYRRKFWDYMAARLGCRPRICDALAVEGKYFDTKVMRKLRVSKTSRGTDSTLHVTAADTGDDLAVVLRDYYLVRRHTSKDFLTTYFLKDLESPSGCTVVYPDDRVGGCDEDEKPQLTGSKSDTIDTQSSVVDEAAEPVITLVHAVGTDRDPELAVEGGQHIVTFSRASYRQVNAMIAVDVKCTSTPSRHSGCECNRCDPTEVFNHWDFTPVANTTYTLVCDNGVMQTVFWDVVKYIYARNASCVVVADDSHPLILAKLKSLPLLCAHGTSAGTMVHTFSYVNEVIPARDRDSHNATAVAISVVMGAGSTTYGEEGSLRISTKKSLNNCSEVSGKVFFSEEFANTNTGMYSDVVVNCTSDVFSKINPDQRQWHTEALLTYTNACEVLVDESHFDLAVGYVNGSLQPLPQDFLRNPVFSLVTAGTSFAVAPDLRSMWVVPHPQTCGSKVSSTFCKPGTNVGTKRRCSCSKCEYTADFPYLVKRHENEVHREQRHFFCEYVGCPSSWKGFTRKAHLKSHVSTVHKE